MKFYLKKFWKINSIAAIFQIGTYGVHAGINLLLMRVFQGIIQKNLDTFFHWLVILILGWGAYFLLRSLQTYFQSRAIRAMNNQVRHDLSLSLLAMNHKDYHANDNGIYLSWLTNNVSKIETQAWLPFFEAIGLVSQVIWSMAALALLHWSLLCASLVSAALMMLLPKLFERPLEKLGKEYAQEQASSIAKIKDLLGGIDILKFFGKSVRFVAQCDDASNNMEGIAHKQRYTKGFIGGFLGFFVILAQVVINVLIGFLSIKGVIIQSAMMGGGNLCGAVSNGLNDLAGVRLSIVSARPYFENITVHAGEEKAASGENLGPVEKAIILENVSFAYDPRKPVVKDQTLTFARGGKYALTGPSGCGKSTLLKLLLGWLPDYTGSIRFDGRDARSYTPDQLQQQMSYIEQNVFLFNSTIRDNITLGGTFSQEQMTKALHESALEEDLKAMPEGLDTPVGEGGSSLSGGQKQRVAIARALIHHRSILLVDEGTSALDQENADIVEKSLLGNPDLTLILVSHHLSPERKACFTRVYELA